MMVARFDEGCLEWTALNGKPSDRPAMDDPKYDEIIATPPDREMKVRLKNCGDGIR